MEVENLAEHVPKVARENVEWSNTTELHSDPILLDLHLEEHFARENSDLSMSFYSDTLEYLDKSISNLELLRF